MQENTTPQLDQRIRKFTNSLKKDFSAEIAENPGAFRSKLIGKIKATLPRQRPGRKSNPKIQLAAKIYQELIGHGRKGRDGVWHYIALRAFPEYATMPMDAQRLIRYSLRAAVHSMRHESLARGKRIDPNLHDHDDGRLPERRNKR